MAKLDGKVAVVTGGSKGIGATIAKGLAAAGATVVVSYASSKEGADAVVCAVGRAVAPAGDVTKAGQAQPDDIADVAVFLASDEARWMTGERLMASGGFR